MRPASTPDRACTTAMKLLILDRDGTLNRSRQDYVASAEEWEALPQALEAVARLNHAGWRVVIATNQSGIGRGLISTAALNAIHTKMHQQLSALGGRIEAVFFCPHAPEDACNCRKPAPGLFLQIGKRLGVDLRHIQAAGNSLRHIQAAAAAGCPVHLLQAEHTGHAPTHPSALPPHTHIHADLPALATWLLAQPSAPA